MKINLYSQYVEDRTTILELFIKNGWELVDEYLLKKKLSGLEAFIQPHAKLLGYSYNVRDDKSHGDQLVPWVALTFSIYHNSEGKETTEGYIVAKMIKDEVMKMSIQPFYDEDANHGIYSTKVGNGYTDLTFYMNPAYPKGWWENHAL